jgi:uncharacterized protein YegP (UPF0339 family)
MRIETFTRKRLLGRPLWYFRIIALNGETVAQSEGYSRRIDCIETAHSLRANLGKAEICDAD